MFKRGAWWQRLAGGRRDFTFGICALFMPHAVVLFKLLASHHADSAARLQLCSDVDEIKSQTTGMCALAH